MASVLLHVLPYVDRDAGEAAALELWHSAKDVARHADGSEGPGMVPERKDGANIMWLIKNYRKSTDILAIFDIFDIFLTVQNGRA